MIIIHTDNEYLFIIENEEGEHKGERLTTYLLTDDITKHDLVERANEEFPGKLQLWGDDDTFNIYQADVLYIDGEFVAKPPYVPTLEDKKNDVIYEYKNKLNRIQELREKAKMAGNPTEPFDERYRELLAKQKAALDKLNESENISEII